MSEKLSDKSLVILDVENGNFLEIPLNNLLSREQFLRVWKSVRSVN